MEKIPERYYVDEIVIAMVVKDYPDIPSEVKSLLEWYRPRINKFEVPWWGDGIRILTHHEVYDMLMWTRGCRTDSEAVKCNTQRLAFLARSLGWEEENEKNYPKPHHII